MRVVSFKIDEDLLRLLEEYSRKKNVTKSEVIRQALRQYIQNQVERPYITRRVRVY